MTDNEFCALCRQEPRAEGKQFGLKCLARVEEGAKRKRDLIEQLNREGK